MRPTSQSNVHRHYRYSLQHTHNRWFVLSRDRGDLRGLRGSGSIAHRKWSRQPSCRGPVFSVRFLMLHAGLDGCTSLRGQLGRVLCGPSRGFADLQSVVRAKYWWIKGRAEWILHTPTALRARNQRLDCSHRESWLTT